MSTDLRLPARVERLERAGLTALGVVAVAALLTGGFLPWYTETVDDDDQTGRLFTRGFELFSAPSESSVEASGVLLGLSFLLLDLVTAAAVVVVVQIIAQAWRQVRFARVLAGFLIACLVGALLTTALAASAERTEVHPASILVYGVGAVLAAVLLLSRELREWWLPTP